MIKQNLGNDDKVLNDKDYLASIDSCRNVAAVISGHFHITKIIQRNGVLHISSPALVQFPNAFRVITLEKTAEGLLVDITLLETGLKEIQEKSRTGSPSAVLQAGKEEDKNFRVLLK